MGDIILPHGGFRHLVVYKKSDVIYQGRSSLNAVSGSGIAVAYYKEMSDKLVRPLKTV